MTTLEDADGTKKVALLPSFFMIFLKAAEKSDFKPFPSSLLTER
jgi:hypothetical protein